MAKSKLTKKQKRNFMIVGAVIGLLLLFMWYNGGDEETEKTTTPASIFSSVSLTKEAQLNYKQKIINNNYPLIITGVPVSAQVGTVIPVVASLNVQESCSDLWGILQLRFDSTLLKEHQTEDFINGGFGDYVIRYNFQTTGLSPKKYSISHQWVCDGIYLGID